MPTLVETQTALLRAALLDGTAAVKEFYAWQAVTDLECLPPGQFSLLPMVYGALEQAGIDHPWLPRLKGIFRRVWYANQLMLKAADALMRSFADAGVLVMLADAAPLALRTYGDRLRPIDALALIVPKTQAAEACFVLAAQGWQPLIPETAAPCGSSIWSTRRRYRSATGQFADLHWHTAPFWPSDDMDVAAWGRARTIALADRPILALAAGDQLARTSRAATMPGPGALIALADGATLLADPEGCAIEWQSVPALAAAGHLLRALLTLLDALGDALGIAAPPDVLARLRAAPVSPIEAREEPIAVQPDRIASQLQVPRLAYAQYRRLAAAQGLAPQPGDFLTYLQQHWGLASRIEIPRHILGRLRQRL